MFAHCAIVFLACIISAFALMHYPYPSYLDKASKEALESYDMIMMNTTATKAEKEMMLDEWAKKQGGDILMNYMKMKEEMMKMDAEMMAMIEKSKLSDEAKTAAQMLLKMEQEKDLTGEQMMQKYAKIMHDLKPEVRQELRMFMDMHFMDMMNKMMEMEKGMMTDGGEKEKDMMMMTTAAKL